MDCGASILFGVESSSPFFGVGHSAFVGMPTSVGDHAVDCAWWQKKKQSCVILLRPATRTKKPGGGHEEIRQPVRSARRVFVIRAAGCWSPRRVSDDNKTTLFFFCAVQSRCPVLSRCYRRLLSFAFVRVFCFRSSEQHQEGRYHRTSGAGGLAPDLRLRCAARQHSPALSPRGNDGGGGVSPHL